MILLFPQILTLLCRAEMRSNGGLFPAEQAHRQRAQHDGVGGHHEQRRERGNPVCREYWTACTTAPSGV